MTGEQFELLRGRRRARPPAPAEPAAQRGVARVVVDVSLPHLDRVFDYAVPAAMDGVAVPGARVRVRFAGQDVDGFVVERAAGTDHPGPLTPLRRVVSAEPVLSPEVLRLCRTVADDCAGTLADVLRLAVPPRHAATEALPPGPAAESEQATRAGVPRAPWAAYPAGAAFLGRIAAGEGPRAVWTALSGLGWAAALAAAAAAALASGRGALIVVPDRRDVDAVDAALLLALGAGRHVRLEADLGPAARYAGFLALRRGQVQVAVGTRAAAFAPVARLGLVALWDDGDDGHAEPRAPYPHARDVLARRAELEGAAALIGGWARTAEGAQLVRSGWARPLEADRPARRQAWPRISTVADGPEAPDTGRMPTTAWRAVHDGLTRGPVLVQVPRAGYVPGTACQQCRRPARCPVCAGPVRLGPAPSPPGCGWCGRVLVDWACRHCGGTRLRARTVGVERTAEEFGRAFPGARVVVSRPARRLPRVPDRAVVLATPGVEPPAESGYAAGVLLDGDSLLERPDLRAAEEALRRWLGAAALVRPSGDGGLVVVVADPVAPAVQALVRLDPEGHAERELADRAELGLPPAAATASATGEPAAVAELLAVLQPPAGTASLGPSPVAEDRVRVVLRAPLPARAELARALHAAASVRSARRDLGPVRIQMDPRDLG